MTPEEKVSLLRDSCNAWAKDCEHYRCALGAVRLLAEPHIAKSGMLAAIHEFCDEALKHDMQCLVCGDYHEGNVPRECETGDGV